MVHRPLLLLDLTALVTHKGVCKTSVLLWFCSLFKILTYYNYCKI